MSNAWRSWTDAPRAESWQVGRRGENLVDFGWLARLNGTLTEGRKDAYAWGRLDSPPAW